MVSFVKGRADQVVHARIDDLEGLRGALFLVEAAGDEHSRVADDVAAGFQEDFQAEILDAGDEFLAVFLDGERALAFGLGRPPTGRAGLEGILIDDADAAADGPELDAMFRLQGAHHRDDLFHRLDERVDGGELRADVHLQAAEADVREFRGGAGIEIRDGGEIDAELVLALAGGDVFVCLRVHVGVHTDRGGGDFPEFPGDLVEIAEFLFALDVERVDALLEGVDDFRAGLADTGEGAVGGISAGLDHAEKLAARDDVEARAFGGEQAEDGEIGVRLDRISDLVIDARQCLVEADEMVGDRPRRIDVKGSAVFLGEGFQGNVFAEKLAVPVGKAVHGRLT